MEIGKTRNCVETRCGVMRGRSFFTQFQVFPMFTITNITVYQYEKCFTKRPFSVIFKSKPTNQVIKYEHEGQVSAKIILEQKADFFKFDSN